MEFSGRVVGQSAEAIDQPPGRRTALRQGFLGGSRGVRGWAEVGGGWLAGVSRGRSPQIALPGLDQAGLRLLLLVLLQPVRIVPDTGAVRQDREQPTGVPGPVQGFALGLPQLVFASLEA